MTRPTWDEYFLEIATCVAKRSPDEETKVGAIIVDSERHIIATGYNGHPPGVEGLPTRRPDKYPAMIHAEINALLHTTKAPRGATLYSTLFPCTDCAKALISAGIKEVVFEREYKDTEYARNLLNLAQVKTRQVTPKT